MKPGKIFYLFVVYSLIGAVGSTDASAFYKKKIQVRPFQNNTGWVGTYSPGAILSDLLKQRIKQHENVVLVKFANPPVSLAPFEKDNSQPSAISGIAEIQTSAQIIVTGRIIQYRPAMPIKLENTKTEKRMSGSAEVQVEIQIYQGQTKRLLTEFILKQKSAGGKFPLGYSQSSLNLRSDDFLKTYMGRALTKLADRMVPVIADYVNQIPLDGQVIAIEKDEEQMIINVGRKSGVEIRDEFIVYSVDVGFIDPLYKEDIGDRLSKLGVVRVINVQEGFSEAVIMAGGDFVKGNMVRSKKFKPLPKDIKDGKSSVASSFSP